MRRIATVLAAAALATAGLTWAGVSRTQDTTATVTVPKAVPPAPLPLLRALVLHGNPARYAKYWAAQTSGDCVEQSARLAMDGLAGHAVATSHGVDMEAYRLGLTGATFDGTVWGPANYRLFRHYGFKAHGPVSMSRARLIADLDAGKVVQVALNANSIWEPQGYSSPNPNDKTTPDHAVIVEAVDSYGNVYLGDTGGKQTRGEIVPWANFSKAWRASGYSAIVVSR